MTNLNDIITQINTLSERNSFDIYIPSLKRNVKFKPLTSKQQKSLYSCVTDNIVYSTRFIIVTYNIIKENCYEQDVIDNLTTLDRIAILLFIRKSTLGVNITVADENTTYTGSIESSIQLINSLEIPSNKTIEIKNIRVELQVPTIEIQYRLEKELREGQATPTMSLDEIVEDAVLSEACKMIKNVWVIDNDQITDTQYNTYSFKDKITLIENLPAEVMFEIQSYATNINSLTSKILTLQEYNPPIPFDITVDFFLDR